MGTMRVKGEAAVQMMAPEAGITCGNASAVVASIHMYSHATEEAKLDWCISNQTAQSDVCTPCTTMPAQPGDIVVGVGADVDYFVFAFKKSEAGKEQELYPDLVSGD